jgi:hypothetical protein
MEQFAVPEEIDNDVVTLAVLLQNGIISIAAFADVDIRLLFCPLP